MIAMDLDDKGVWYRIYVGNFENKQQAEEYWVTVKNDYQDSFIRAIK